MSMNWLYDKGDFVKHCQRGFMLIVSLEKIGRYKAVHLSPGSDLQGTFAVINEEFIVKKVEAQKSSYIHPRLNRPEIGCLFRHMFNFEVGIVTDLLHAEIEYVSMLVNPGNCGTFSTNHCAFYENPIKYLTSKHF